MAKNKVVDKNQPKSLTSAQRMFVEQLQTRFGERFTLVKRAELKKAAKEILKTATAPAWITRNLKVRIKAKRGMYDLSVLLKLPVVAFDEPKKAKKKTVAKAPKAPKAPKETPVVDNIPVPVIDTETALAVAAGKKLKKPTKKVVVPESEPEEVEIKSQDEKEEDPFADVE
jgi:hypothetical protein